MLPFQSHSRNSAAEVGFVISRCWMRVKNTVSIDSIREIVNMARTVKLTSLSEFNVNMVAAADAKRDPCKAVSSWIL
jgi:hypothetical protein